MKTLKFFPNLVPLILSGEKFCTWRFFDDKDLSVGDELEFLNKETGEIFGRAKIWSVKEKKLGDIKEEELEGHEKFESREKMFEAYKKYYGDKISEDSLVKIIKFNFREKNKHVRVGTGVMLKKGNKILLGKRHVDKLETNYKIRENNLEATWSMPGGKLELGETLFDCAKREVFEETGIKILDMDLISLRDASESTGYFMTVAFISENFEGEPKDMEREKISEWGWFDLDNLPSPLFGPSKQAIESYIKKNIYIKN